MTQSSDALAVIQKRLNRAEEHRNAVQRDFRRIQENHSIIRAEPNTEQTFLDVFLNLPEEQWFLEFSESIHQMRAALDNLAYALHVAHSGTPHPGYAHRIAFPIYTTADEFKGRGERAIEGLNPDAQTFIRRAQPYNRRNRPEFHELAILSELSNRDKHRVPHFALMEFPGVGFKLDPPDFPVLGVDVTTTPPENGAHLMRIHFGEPLRRGVNVYFNLPGIVGADYSWTVGRLANAVETTIRIPLDSTLIHLHRRTCRVVNVLSRFL